MQKRSTWLSNFSLSSLELQCRNSRSVLDCTHEHRQVKGGVSTKEGYVNLASYSGKYTPEQSTVYAREVKAYIRQNFARGGSIDAETRRKAKAHFATTHLGKMARSAELRLKGGSHEDWQAAVRQEDFPVEEWSDQYLASINDDLPADPFEDEYKEIEAVSELPDPGPESRRCARLEYRAGGGVLDLHSGLVLDESLTYKGEFCGRTEVPQNMKPPKPVDQYHRVLHKAGDDEVLDVSTSHEIEMKKRAQQARHEENYRAACKRWKEIADRKDWDAVKADLEVYKYCGTRVETDPRRNEEYREESLMA